MDSTSVPAIYRGDASRNMIFTGTFSRPVKIDTAIHAPCPECDRSTIIIAAIIEDCGWNKCDPTGTIISQAYDRMLITIRYRHHIIYDGDGDAACTAVATLIADCPYHYVSA